MLARPSNGDAVEKFKEIEVQCTEDILCRSFFRWQLGPHVERGLRPAEDFVDVFFRVQLLFDTFRVTLVRECQLIAQIAEAVVDRSCRQHQDLRLDAVPDDGVHQLVVSGFTFLECVVVSEVVRLVDHDQVVVAPVDAIQRCAERFTRRSLQVRVAQNVVIEAVFGKQVGLQIAIECQPVIRQFLRTKNEHAAIAKFVILDDAECRECLPQPNTVGEDAAIEGLQLVDDAGCGISLEVEHLVPDEAVFVPRHVVGQNIFV